MVRNIVRRYELRIVKTSATQMKAEKDKAHMISVKKIGLCFILVGTLCLFLVAGYIYSDRNFDTFREIQTKKIPPDWAESIKIGIIGDSWVAGKKLDAAIRDTFRNEGFAVDVVSTGQPGAKSRQIYRNIFLEINAVFSSRHILWDEDVDYLVVVAGVNDTAAHIGSDFYAHHVRCILQTAMARGIHPVLLEVPEYGIEHIHGENVLSGVKGWLYKSLFDHGKDDVIDDYRQALRVRITNMSLDDLTIVSMDSMIPDYTSNMRLYETPSHLTRKGYRQLGVLIAENILVIHKKRVLNQKEEGL